MPDDFFEDQSDSSARKALIVSKYFSAWSTIMLKSAKKAQIGYLDLFAGAGIYEDHSKSTPILVLEGAIRRPPVAGSLHANFNEPDSKYAVTLRNAIAALPGINSIGHRAHVHEHEVNPALLPWVAQLTRIPTLTFIDPFGYKGVTRDLIRTCLRTDGSDVVLFFNYNRVNAALSNPVMRENINALFGLARAGRLRSTVENLDPEDRETAIVSGLEEAMSECGGASVSRFVFISRSNSKTSHHLFVISKSRLSGKIAKDIMAREGDRDEFGNPIGTFNPKPSPRQADLFAKLNPTPTETLGAELLREFQGQDVRVNDVFYLHQHKTQHPETFYKKALIELEQAGRVTCKPPADERPRRKGHPTMGEHVLVVFPPVSPK